MRQFADVFAHVKDWMSDPLGVTIFAPSFNEFVTSRKPIAARVFNNVNKYIKAVGMSDSDPDRFSLFVDGYGAHRGRTLEPSLEDGGRYWDLFSSCARVTRFIAHPSTWTLPRARAEANCEVSGEPCCDFAPDQLFSPVWSIERHPSDWVPVHLADTNWTAADTILTNERSELDSYLLSAPVRACKPLALIGWPDNL